MDALAAEFEPAGVRSVFIYTQEAHPGDDWPNHSSFEHKLEAACKFVEQCGLQRPMLVDTLDGEVHRAYGALPNMSWIISRTGKILYKADWTDPRTIRQALEQLGFEIGERRDGAHLTPYYMETLPQRPNSTEEFMQGLLDVGGPRSAHEFLDAIAAGSGGEQAVARMREWVIRRLEEKPIPPDTA
ncbi:MAG: hypothetical protein IIC93_07685 [Chloroflexi bacterium]|nr:hypothetical protein [Chloroflexota bacterium]